MYSVTGLDVDRAGDVVAAWQYDDVMVSKLPAGSGTWQQPVAIPSSAPGLQALTVGFDGSGGIVAVWAVPDTYDSGTLLGWRLPAGATAWTAPATLSETGFLINAGVVIDHDGDAVVAFETTNAASVVATLLDSAAPRAASVSIPRTGRAARRLAFAATPADISAVTFHWRFGDGKTASGARATHAYREAGRYVVTLVATDAAGHAATLARTSVRVSAARS
jgi:hypothetical protein